MDFSLSIGIDEYLNLYRAPYSENDSKEFDLVMKNIYQIDGSILLSRDQATWININSNIEDLCNKISEEDRLMFFYAGHGINIKGVPHLSCYDSNMRYSNSFISLIDIIERINSSECKRNLFFIDACESTLQLGSRETISRFNMKEYENYSESVTYSSVFCSTSHNDKADVDRKAKHGIWTKYLLKALSGKATKALNSKLLLTNKTLQNYLSSSVKQYCRNHPEVQIQNSFTWGKEEGEYIIKSFVQRKMIKDVSISDSAIIKSILTSLSLKEIKNLSGFHKVSHFLPEMSDSIPDIRDIMSNHIPENSFYIPNDFVDQLAEKEIRDHTNHVLDWLRDSFDFESDDYKFDYNNGCAVIETLYFTYSFFAEVYWGNLNKIRFTTELSSISPKMLNDYLDKLNDCPYFRFNELEFTPRRPFGFDELYQLMLKWYENGTPEEYSVYFKNYPRKIEVYNKKLSNYATITENSIIIHCRKEVSMEYIFESLKIFASLLNQISNKYDILA